MNTKTASVGLIVGAVAAISLVANAAMAQRTGAGKPQEDFKEPVLLIKTCWGGHSLYGNFRPPSAGKTAYETGYKPEEIGASYHKMVKEVRECLATLDTGFPKLKGLKTELCGFVWFQGWNDMCQPGDQIRQQVYDEYCPNFVHLVHDLRAEFKVPNLPVVMGELGVGGENADKNMADFRAAQARIATCPELKGKLGYVRTAPFMYCMVGYSLAEAMKPLLQRK